MLYLASDAFTRSRGNMVEPLTTVAGLIPLTRLPTTPGHIWLCIAGFLCWLTAPIVAVTTSFFVSFPRLGCPVRNVSGEREDRTCWDFQCARLPSPPPQ